MTAVALPYGLSSRDEAPRYFAWMADLFAEAIAGDVLDHGAGTGALTARLLLRARRVVALEPEATLCALLSERFRSEPKLEVLRGTIETYLDERGPATLDAVLSSNVLEHLDDDVGCLARLREALRPGGALAVYVPARQELMGSLDRSVGHVRRYSRSELRRKLNLAGFQVSWVRYRNLAGVLPWLVAGRLLGKRELGGGQLRVFDRFVFPASQLIEARLQLPYGLNVAALARRR